MEFRNLLAFSNDIIIEALKAYKGNTKMIAIDKLKKGKEYYFYTQNFFWSGFFIESVDGNVHIKNGHLYCANNIVYAYNEAFLDINELIGFAGT